MLKSFVLVVICGFSPGLYGATYYLSMFSVAKVHFSNEYYGEKVTSVTADIGLDTTGQSRRWQGLIEKEPLNPGPRGFFTTVELKGNLATGGSLRETFAGVAVTYYVTLESGRTVKIENLHIPRSDTKFLCLYTPQYMSTNDYNRLKNEIQEFSLPSPYDRGSSALVYTDNTIGEGVETSCVAHQVAPDFH